MTQEFITVPTTQGTTMSIIKMANRWPTKFKKSRKTVF